MISVPAVHSFPIAIRSWAGHNHGMHATNLLTKSDGFAEVKSLGDLLRHLGSIPADRVWLRPSPGSAQEQDVLDIEARENRLCELIDGVLVEKTMSSKESQLAMWLGYVLLQYLEQHDLGTVLGADGMLRLFPGQIRIPDVSFIAWRQLPEGKLPDEAIASVYPDLAIEVLSEGNTAQEMKRKLRDYFQAGTRLVWHIDPSTRTVQVFTSPTKSRVLSDPDILEGGKVLPGFQLPIRELFDRERRVKAK